MLYIWFSSYIEFDFQLEMVKFISFEYFHENNLLESAPRDMDHATRGVEMIITKFDFNIKLENVNRSKLMSGTFIKRFIAAV